MKSQKKYKIILLISQKTNGVLAKRGCIVKKHREEKEDETMFKLWQLV